MLSTLLILEAGRRAQQKSEVKSTNNETGYIQVTTNAVSRLSIETPKEVLGLLTQDLEICIGVIIYNKSTKRLSLIHKAPLVDPSEVIKEFKWVLKDPQHKSHCSITLIVGRGLTQDARKPILFRNMTELTTCLASHQLDLNIQDPIIISDSAFLSVDRNGNIKTKNIDKLSKLSFPQLKDREGLNLKYAIEGEAIQKRISLDLQYNATSWTPLPQWKLNLKSPFNISLFRQLAWMNHVYSSLARQENKGSSSRSDLASISTSMRRS